MIRYLFRNWFAIASILFITVSTVSGQDSTRFKIRLEALPEQKLIPAFAADGRAYRMSAMNMIGTNDFVGGIGGIFPATNIHIGNKIVQFGVAAASYLTLKRYIDHGILLNTDFFVDFNFDYKISSNSYLRLGAGHTSQHLSDDAVKVRREINYVRDYVDLILYRTIPTQHLSYYVGFYINHNFKIADSTTLKNLSGTPLIQFGFEHVPFKISKNSRFYYAADIKLRGEFNYQSTHNFHCGVKFKKQDSRVIRLAINYNGGKEERGQLYKNDHDFWGAGVYFEF